MYLNTKMEPNKKAWGFRLLMGPACFVDGVVSLMTLSFVSTGLALTVSRKLAKARMMPKSSNVELSGVTGFFGTSA